MRYSRPPKFVPVLFLMVGLGLLAGAGYVWAARRAKVAHWVRTSGVVVGLESRGNCAVPVVRFQPLPGLAWPEAEASVPAVEVMGSVESSPPAHEVGEKVAVLYDPAKPRDAVLDTFLERHFVTLVLGAIGAAFTFFGAAFSWMAWRR